MKVLALDIGGTKVASAEVDTDTLLFEPLSSFPTEPHKGGADLFTRVCNLIEEVLSSRRIDAIGIASAGVVGPDGSITAATDLIPRWAGTPLGPDVRKRFPLPVSVLNDVHAHALGEVKAGAGMGSARCLVAGIGTGIGGGLVVDGIIDRGSRGIAGHIGHIQHPSAQGYACSCGREGHIESIASGTGILHFHKRNNPHCTVASTRELSEAAQSGDTDALATFTASGFALGESLACLANVLDPDRIVLAGSVTQAGQFWLDAITRGFAHQAMNAVANTPIVVGSLSNAALLGAAIEVTHHNAISK